MDIRRFHWIAAGTLLVATALAGAATRGPGRNAVAVGPSNATTFAAPPKGRVTFSGTLDRTAVLRGRDGLARLELFIAATPDEPATATTRRPTDVVIILDRSGSMGGEKIMHARAAVRELIGQLAPEDRFALVTYADSAGLTIPLEPVSPGLQAAWLAAVAAVQPTGSTNMSNGLDVGFDVVQAARMSGRVPHMILISDGLANQGDASLEGLTNRARRAAQGEFMLSTVGVGADFNESLMAAMADSGTGNYYYLQNAADLATVFAREFDAARTTVASALAVQIEPAAGVQVVDAAGYPLELAGDRVLFRPGSLFAGQQRRIWVTLAAPQQTVGMHDLGRFSLSYGDGQERTTLTFTEMPRIACVESEDQFYASLDVPSWTRSVLVDGYNKMQETVAREVKAGRRDEALEAVRQFRAETSLLNDHVQSAPVGERLRGLGELEDDVNALFVGPEQAERQNFLSKSMGLGAVDARRAGSKK